MQSRHSECLRHNRPSRDLLPTSAGACVSRSAPVAPLPLKDRSPSLRQESPARHQPLFQFECRAQRSPGFSSAPRFAHQSTYPRGSQSTPQAPSLPARTQLHHPARTKETQTRYATWIVPPEISYFCSGRLFCRERSEGLRRAYFLRLWPFSTVLRPQQIPLDPPVTVLLRPQTQRHRRDIIHQRHCIAILRQIDRPQKTLAGLATLHADVRKLLGDIHRKFLLVFLPTRSAKNPPEV